MATVLKKGGVSVCLGLVLGVFGGCTSSEGGASSGGAGAAGGAAGTGAAGGSTSGGASAGGGGGVAGSGTGGSAGSGGAGGSGGTPVPARPCLGAATAASGEPSVLRTDMTITKVMDLPGDGVRLARHPTTGVLYMLHQDGDLSRILLEGTPTLDEFMQSEEAGIHSDAEALGMAFASDGTIFIVSHTTAEQSATTSQATIWRGTPMGEGFTWSKVAETVEYPRSNTFFDHEWSGIAVSPDQTSLYVNAGSRTDHGEVQDADGAHPSAREVGLTAAIFRIPIDAQNLSLPNDRATLKSMGLVFAEGTRNSYDPEFAPNGDLIAGDNGPDGDYHEELNWLREGVHYGFPWRMGNEDNAMQFPSYDPGANGENDPRLQGDFFGVSSGSWHNDPGFPPKPDGVVLVDPIVNVGPDADEYRNVDTGTIDDASETGKPFATFTDHGSPLGLTFDPGAGALCGEFHGAAFILRFGKGGGQAFEPGRDLLHLALSKAGDAYSLSTTQIASGFVAPIDAVLVEDTLYVLDRMPTSSGDAPGALYAIQLPTGN